MCPCPERKIQICSGGEGVEVAIARNERDALVDTALRNQRIAETGLTAFCQHFSSQRSCPLPVTRRELDERYF